jgi:hypothetical protein
MVDAGRISTALAMVIAGLLALSSAALAAPKASVVLYSDPEDYIGLGRPEFLSAPRDRIQVDGDSGYLRVGVLSKAGESYRLDFEAPDERTLTRGIYTRAHGSHPDPGRPSIEIGGEGRGCNQHAGEFEVKDVALDARGEISRLWVVFAHHCELRTPAVFGEVRIGQRIDRAPLVPAPAVVRWPDLDPGRRSTDVPVNVTARRRLTIRSATLAGDGRRAFAIVRDGCSGTRLGAGRSCTVTMRHAPDAAGTRVAALRLTDSAGRRRDVALEGFQHGGRTRLAVQSEPGGEVWPAGDWSYGWSDSIFHLAGDGASAGVVVNRTPDDGWRVNLQPREGEALAVGNYPDAQGGNPLSAAQPYMEVSGQLRDCREDPLGAFTIREITFHPDGGLRTLGADFEQRCEGQSGALRGTVEYRVDDPVARPPWLVPSRLPKPAPQAGACEERARDVDTNLLRGTARSERLRGWVLRDAIFGGSGDDRIWGREGADCLDGGPGDDRLDGGPGTDMLRCGPGADVARAGAGDSTRDCERVIRVK